MKNKKKRNKEYIIFEKCNKIRYNKTEKRNKDWYANTKVIMWEKYKYN